MKTRAVVCLALTLLMGTASLAGAQAFTWYIDDGPDGTYIWTDTGIGPFWEPMGAAAFEDTICTFTDLPVATEVPAYYACSPAESFDYSGYGFWADLYLSNNFADHSNPATVTLGTGICGDELSFTAVATPVTLNVVDFDPELDCGVAYRFDFGVIQTLVLDGESLVLKIEYSGIDYDAHIFWDAECCPSALACEEGTATEATHFGSVKTLY